MDDHRHVFYVRTFENEINDPIARLSSSAVATFEGIVDSLQTESLVKWFVVNLSNERRCFALMVGWMN
ncbi:hypothetical protein PInf_019859 [Phytophthora infestans]|nr:hypothetical protein PInf_019859 [Phytophthora infestans]